MDKVERKRLGGLMDEVEHEGLGELVARRNVKDKLAWRMRWNVKD